MTCIPNFLIIFMCIIFTSTTMSNTLSLSNEVICEVDYRGIIHFVFNLSRGDELWESPLLYYRNYDTQWKNVTSCKRTAFEYRCRMYELTTSSGIGGRYSFKFSATSNGKVFNITDLHFASNHNKEVSPWLYFNQLSYCKDGYGIKFIKANTSISTTSIKLTWILFPLDAKSSNVYESDLSVIDANGTNLNTKEDINEDNCVNDRCTYTIGPSVGISLKPCSKYTICFKTRGNTWAPEEDKYQCKNVTTICEHYSGKQFYDKFYMTPLQWVIVLTVFCCVVLFITFVLARVRRYVQRYVYEL